MGNRQQRRHPGKAQGMSYADRLARCIAEEILELDGAMLELAVSKWSRWLAEETEIRRVEEA